MSIEKGGEDTGVPGIRAQQCVSCDDSDPWCAMEVGLLGGKYGRQVFIQL